MSTHSVTGAPAVTGTLALIASALLLAACASHPAAPAAPNLEQRLAKLGYKQGDSVDRVSHYSVDGWNFVDEQHVIFAAGPSRYFLVTVMTPCTGLRSADSIAFTTTELDVTTFDKLIVRDAGFSDQCPIKGFNELQRIKKDAQS